MKNSIDNALSEFQSGHITVQVAKAMLSIMPEGPPFALYEDIQGAANRLGSAVPDAGTAADEWGRKTQRTIRIGEWLDRIDAGIAIGAGLRSLWRFGTGSGLKESLQFDGPQAADASLKLAALAYMFADLFDGLPADRFRAAWKVPAFREIFWCYAVGDVALPFSDNAIRAAGPLTQKLVDMARSSGTGKLTEVAGAVPNQAGAMLSQFAGPLESTLKQAGPHLGELVEKLKTFMPKALALTDSVTGTLATGIDALPLYRFLTSRLAAEAYVAGLSGQPA